MVRWFPEKTDFVKALILVSLISLAVLLPSFSGNGNFILIAAILTSFFSLPIGLALGWIIFDVYMRARVMRTLLRKNYGVLHIVSRGKNIVTKVLNFDSSVVELNNFVWVINPKKIYSLEKQDLSGSEEKVFAEVRQEAIKAGREYVEKDGKLFTEVNSYTLQDKLYKVMGVPALFVDYDTVEPIGLSQDIDEKSNVTPEAMGSILKGWIYNQLAKNLLTRRNLQIGVVLVLIAVVGVGVGLYYVHQQNSEILEILKDPSTRVLLDNVTRAGNVIVQGAGR